MIYSVILAGGSGKRFWPVSKEEEPKQLLPLIGDKPLIVQTKERALSISSPDKIKVVTTSLLAEKIESLGFSKENIIIEPKGMNTLYAIALSAAKLMRMDKDALMLILPSDHWIAGREEFVSTIKKGIEWAKRGNLITYGIVPTRPETGYGYIEKGEKVGNNVLKVKRFTEKPNIKKATDYLKSNNFLWNSGIFLWKPEVILEEIKRYQPHLSKEIESLQKSPTDENIRLLYEKDQPISIDYGVLERSKKVLIVISEFKWDDVGAWTSLERILPTTEDGNIEEGNIFSINSHDNIFYAEEGIIVAKGLSKMIVVHTDKTTLIIPKSDAQEVKEIIHFLPDEYK
ncbi:MAG: sugar phosphate nucleotidyltransferase [candidate division WOR-3 bacterium]|nr:sugar phosphate nucleotidyltransferase [candidate division WOR-3 bacterium]